jgi:glucokinase
MILAGDVGGTKTVLALFEDDLKPVREETLPSADFDSLESAIDRFLGEGDRPAVDVACVGVAGPVVDGRCAATNLPWLVDEHALMYAIPAHRAKVLNDLEAAAHGVLGLEEHELIPLQTGSPRRGNLALIAAGTGLGEAIISTDGQRRIVIGSEGGHGSFAPRTDLEDGLLAFLRREFGHVSWERVLSGPGLHNIYRFLRETGVAPETRAVAEAIDTQDPGAVITRRALANDDPLCVKALELFVSLYGAEAGNLALKAMAVGGVVVGGGIAPRILPRLQEGSFVAAFRDKGRMAELLETIPVHVALNPKAPLLGAARVAATLL